MVKSKNKWIWIILIIIVIFLFYNLPTKKTGIKEYSSSTRCEEERQDEINYGDKCVGQCIKVTSSMKNCLDENTGETSIVGYYAFYSDRDETCQEIIDRGSKQYICLYGTIVNICSDTDGDNYEIKGTVTSNGKSYTDYCDGIYTIEYSCEPVLNTIKNTRIWCNPSMYSGCQDGACIKSSTTCLGSSTQSCTVGSCAGTQIRTCSNGVWSDFGICVKTDPNCDGVCTPATEICNQIDDDCDGQIDEGLNCQMPTLKCEIYQQGTYPNCKIATWVYIVGGLFLFMFMMSMMKRK